MRREAIEGFAHSAGDFLRLHILPRAGQEVVSIKEEFDKVYFDSPDVRSIGVGVERFALIGCRNIISVSLDGNWRELGMPNSYKGVPVKYTVEDSSHQWRLANSRLARAC